MKTHRAPITGKKKKKSHTNVFVLVITYLTAAATAAGDQRAACVKGVAPTVAWAIVVAQDSRSCETKFKKNNTHMATNMHTIMATA